ncbi:tetratricopeptide repeat protein [Phenylobacterium sp.]|uniref:O-linked N-acetylglucosamine transferase, SPINDLY family protein n=1 Tax=Phenylobacterium sp. TaxID=1871053 RepID=UPI0028971A42|nr:tetratricopeptide repeat protein [Phenylobacterium sp.]
MSLDRFAPAEAALKAGDVNEGVRLIEAELAIDPKAPVGLYRNFTTILFRHGRVEQMGRWAAAGVELYPKDYDLWNMLGVSHRRAKNFDEAIKAFRVAEKLNPKNTSALSNRGNVYNDMRNGPAAVEVFTKLVRLQPNSAELQRNLGRAYWFSGDLEKAQMRLNLALKFKPDLVDAWLDLAAVAADRKGYPEALEVTDQALAVLPDEMRLHEARTTALRRSGRLRDAEAYLISLRDRYEDKPWLHHQLGGVISDYDRRRGNEHMQTAVRLAPDNLDYRIALIESLGRSRHGVEAEHLERAYQLLKEALTPDIRLTPSSLKVALEVLIRLGDYDSAAKLGSFSEVGRKWAGNGKHTALLGHLARITSDEDRLELVEMHRIWGRLVADAVKRWPIERPAPRPENGKFRIGFMSSDLRNHPVAYFAMPLFEHLDRDRFEVYCYSFFQGDTVDATQARIAACVDVFRWEKDIGDRDAAQMIANDQLDMLIELGGSTHMNKLGVMGFKPAPLQASWLGYPHSAGLETIDHLILDPYVAPTSRDLLIEEPLLMPKSWIAMGEQAFPERPITEGTPQQRKGFLTFGTANNPYKYSREMVRTWARVTASVENAQFLFVRPEGGAPTFRRNMLELFAAEGVGAERVRFEDVRGAHMPFYNEIDIALDTFPQTGGTTTCEALWMGVPTVSLVGEAMFERLSYSILVNAGLGDLCARTPDEFVEIALRLAGDHDRRATLRTGLRGMLKASPLGQTRQFAADFYEMLEGAISRARASGKIAA